MPLDKPTRARIVAKNLSKWFAGASRPALDGVTFEVPPGHGLAVVGENGAGKSTLLDLLLGAARPTRGELAVESSVSSLLDLGAGLFLELSARENAYHVGLIAGASPTEARNRAAAALAFAELDHEDRPLRELSAGNLMRLGFALAANETAQVVLVDEVLAVGDGYFQRKCIDRLLALKARGASLVIATHDLHAVRGLCDRGLWLRGGRTAASGPVGEVIDQYESHLRLRIGEAARPSALAGTGEIVIESVTLSSADGAERSSFDAGETIRVEVVFSTTRPVESPVMGVAIFRDDGVYCAGPNTGFDDVLKGTYDGRYRFTAEFVDPPLLSGRYEASVAFYDSAHVYAYAWKHRGWPFELKSPVRDHGLVRIEHRFAVERIAPRVA